MPNFTLGRFSFHRQIYFLAFSDGLSVEKKNCPAHPVQSFVTRSGRIGAQIFFFLCPNLSNIYQNLSNSVTVNFLIGGPLAFRLFKPIVNDDYHQEHKEFWWRVSLSHFSLWNEEEKAFVFVGFLFCVSFFRSVESLSVRSRNCSLLISKAHNPWGCWR